MAFHLRGVERRTKMIRQRVFATKTLKQVRTSSGMLQNEAADAMTKVLEKSISASYYQKIEQGKKPILLSDALKIEGFWQEAGFWSGGEPMFKKGFTIKREGREIE
jgi:transcriptional regulator with XRE-family HTH domain